MIIIALDVRFEFILVNGQPQLAHFSPATAEKSSFVIIPDEGSGFEEGALYERVVCREEPARPSVRVDGMHHELYRAVRVARALAREISHAHAEY